MMHAKVISITLLYEGNIYIKQDRQYTYNIKLRRVRVTTVVVEKQW
jgi:hypothetical protein